MTWYFHTWRVATFTFGLFALLLGSVIDPVQDWNAPVSLLMAGATYLLMPVFNRFASDIRTWPLAYVVGDWPVNGVYTLYWGFTNPTVMSVENNYLASWMLFLLCWAIWCNTPQTLRDAFVSGKQLVKAGWSTATNSAERLSELVRRNHRSNS